MRTRITLACTECKNRNYDTTKDKKTHPDRIEIRKYCKFCKKHTTHKETKSAAYQADHNRVGRHRELVSSDVYLVPESGGILWKM